MNEAVKPDPEAGADAPTDEESRARGPLETDKLRGVTPGGPAPLFKAASTTVTPAPPAPPLDQNEPKPSYLTDVYLRPSPENPRSLVFAPTAGAGERPQELSDLMGQFTKVARDASDLLFDDLEQRRSLLENIQVAARLTLCGSGFSLSDASANVANFRQQVVDAAVPVRSRRLKTYNKFLIWLGLLPCILGVAFYRTGGFGLNAATVGPELAGLCGLLATALLIAAGATISVWAEFVLRVHEPPTYEQVLTLDTGRWSPGQRVGITIVISFVFAYLLALKVVLIGLGNILLNEFVDKTPELALAVGGITGLAFSAVRDVIYRVKPEDRKSGAT